MVRIIDYYSDNTFDVLISVISTVALLLICMLIKFIRYKEYKKNDKILFGTISNIRSFKVYNINIISEFKTYNTTYSLIPSKIKNTVGCKCTFVVNKNGRVLIKDIDI